MVKSRAAAPRRARSQQPTKSRDDGRRIAQMMELVAGAKEIADTSGERFVAYLLAIVIEELGQMEVRRAGKLAASSRVTSAPTKTDAR
ncbi:MAG: hypothetical protein OTI36_06635 [Beijerinckiaceae bacterium]|nr:hypothetical protein [Beijerinckiaceae bacterium]